MNQKELLEKELADHHFHRGAFMTCLAFSIVLIFYSFFVFQLSFKVISLVALIIAYWSLYDMKKLNLRWKAEYKLKEKSK